MTSGASAATRHNHPIDIVSPEKRKRRSELKTAAKANRATPSMTLAADAQAGLQPYQLQQMPTERALQQAVNRARKVPGSADADKPLSEMKLPDEMTKTLRGQRYLLVDSRVEEPEKPAFLVFASQTGIQLLRDYHDWLLDGTFYRHVLSINAFRGKSCVTGVTILMTKCDQATYKRALDATFDHPELSGIKPKSFITDFEKALSNSMAQRFPEADQYFCHFHMSKAAFTNIQKRGLLPLYEVPDIKSLLRSFSSLAFLPVDDVPRGFRDICETLTELAEQGVIPGDFIGKLNEFQEYFRSTYVGTEVRGQYIGARFDMELWNCFTRTLQGSARTTNALEGLHNWINSQFPRSDMVMSQFVVRLQREEERTHNISLRNELNPSEPVRGRSSEATKRENNLRELCIQYNDLPPAERGEKRLLHLLKCQYHLSAAAHSKPGIHLFCL
ncbi:hypothetical protein AAVH_29737 [Aphelenchoides avenae]|nr:hypothetical protein AAVH_29737 [Aphelenchus avenae]